MSDGEKKVFLLIHGFSGTHYEMKPLEDFLKSKGYVTKNITLPGHETNPKDMAKRSWIEWVDFAQNALDELKREYEKVYVAGLSMGGSITLYLAAKNPDIAGIIPMAAAIEIPDKKAKILELLPFLRYIIPWLPNIECGWEDEEAKEKHRCYKKFHAKSVYQLIMLLNDLQRIISLVNVPTLILHSKKDPAVPTKHAEKIFNAIQSKDKKIVWIEKGGHVIPEDAGREQAFSTIEEWLKSH
ncbi:MAG: alpha/beta hydrolase [Candidatus Heimdallarchaeaceae archaeon]